MFNYRNLFSMAITMPGALAQFDREQEAERQNRREEREKAKEIDPVARAQNLSDLPMRQDRLAQTF